MILTKMHRFVVKEPHVLHGYVKIGSVFPVLTNKRGGM